MVEMKVVTVQISMPLEMHERLVKLKAKRNWTDFIEEELLTEKIQIPKSQEKILEKLSEIHNIPLAELHERIRKFANNDATCLHFEKIAVDNMEYRTRTACGLLFNELVPSKPMTEEKIEQHFKELYDERIEQHFKEVAEEEKKEAAK